jgi:Na+/phosphate symporter
MNVYIDFDFDHEIATLEKTREFNQQKYIENVEKIDNKLETLSNQLERTKSPVKKEILMRQIDFYENEYSKMDQAIEIVTNDIDEKLKKYRKLKSDREEIKKKEKQSVEYNIKKLREAIDRANTSEIFSMFNNVANALEILRVEKTQT